MHQADDIAHAQDPACHPFGSEGFELVGGFAEAAEDDRRARDLLDAERSTASCVAVQLREYYAGDTEQLVEVFRGDDRVLADHRVDDEVDVVGGDNVLDGAQFLHQGLVDRESAGRVVDDDVTAKLLRFLFGGGADVRRALAGDIEHWDLKLFAEDLQLLDSGRPLHVCGDQHRLVVVLLQQSRELRAGGRLASTLQADHDDLCRALVGEMQGFGVVGHERHKFLVTHTNELVARAHRVLGALVFDASCDGLADGTLFDPLEEGLGHTEFDVGLEQAEPYLAQGRIDILLGQLGEAGESVPRLAKALRDRIKHRRIAS